MIVQEERAMCKAKTEFAGMVEAVERAAEEGQVMNEVERELWRGLLRIGRLMLQGHVDAQGTGDVGETLEYEGRTLRRLPELYRRSYVSVFGEIGMERYVYGTRASQKQEVVPLDARLALPEGKFSYLLQEWSQGFCVEESFQQAAGRVKQILGIGQSVGTLEHMNRSMAEDVEGFRAAEPVPPPEEEGSILVATADGKGVPMRRDGVKETGGAHHRRSKGEKANKKREACVGAVYTIEPHCRTSEDILDTLLRKKTEEDRPKPQHKRVRAELTRLIDGEETTGKESIFSWFLEEVELRDPKAAKALVCLLDGDRALWRKLKEYLPDAIGILDLFHVMERLWDIAHCFHPEGSKKAEAFVTERLRGLLEGRAGRMIGGLKQMATKQKLRGSRRKRFEIAIRYLQNNKEHMAYNEYLAKGYPIGSGVAEGACRHLVKDRMERTGMRWQTQGAQAMLHLRAVHINGDWDAFQQDRITRHTERLYPYRDSILVHWEAAA